MRTRSAALILAIAAFTLGAMTVPAGAALVDTARTATAPPMTAVMTGANEVGGTGDPTGAALAGVTIDTVHNMLCYELKITADLDSAPTAAHIHKAAAGATGPVVQALTPPSAGTAGSASRDCVTPADVTLIPGLIADPSAYYVNIHNTNHAGGAVRGQLAFTGHRSVAPLSGMLEQTGAGVNNQGDQDGAGRAVVWVNTTQLTVCVWLSVTGIDTATAAHIHKATAGSNGPVVVALDAPDDGFSLTCTTASSTDVNALATDPTGYYVNVHTAAFPAGALRGQLAPAGAGYRLIASDGGVFGFGQGTFLGSRGGSVNNAPFVGGATTLSRAGYWLVSSDGGIFTFGDAGFFGSEGAKPLNKPIVGIAATPTGKGYWLVASDGGIFTHGDAGFFGSEGDRVLNAPIVGMAATPTGKGYWLVASDGGIFAHGDAGFFGSEGAKALNKPIVGIASTPLGLGYWLVASDGGIFTHGDAGFFGSTGGIKLNQPVVGMLASPRGLGYVLAASDGGTFTFGDGEFAGSTGSTKLNKPIVAITF